MEITAVMNSERLASACAEYVRRMGFGRAVAHGTRLWVLCTPDAHPFAEGMIISAAGFPTTTTELV